MAVCDITVVPEGVENSYTVVDGVIETIAQSGLSYEVDAMSTAVEGDLDALFAVTRAAHNRAFELGAKTVLTTLRIHDSREIQPTIDNKVGKHRAAQK